MLKVQSQQIREVAESKIGDISLTYTYQYNQGSRPDTITARGTVENSPFVIDVSYYITNGNLQFTFHYTDENTDLSIAGKILEEIRTILSNFSVAGNQTT